LVGKNSTIYQQGVNGILPSVGVSHSVKKFSRLIILP
jgi:hypothetical protein